MKRGMQFTFSVGCLVSTFALGADWSFDAAINVTDAQGGGVFHHLDSAGRRSIATHASVIGVTWEDNRDGTPRCYFATKSTADANFKKDIQISGKGECYEPSAAAFGANQFVVAWEEGGQVHARIVDAGGAEKSPSQTITLSEHASSQISLGARGDVIYAAWAEQDGKFSRIHIARLVAEKNQLSIAHRTKPDQAKLADDQLFPSIAPGPQSEVVVTWEDRRNGHTFIVQAFSADGKQFDGWRQVNSTRDVIAPPTTSRIRTLGRGPGAMRAALARMDDKRLAITWLDKRDFLSGYDIYAAISEDGGRTFGANQKVQDSFGDTYAQWHPTISGYGNSLVVAWDDERDGSSDVWLSWRQGNSWADNVAPEPAAGPGIQSHSSAAVDSQGALHLVWIDRQEMEGPTRLRYLRGQR